MEEQEYQVLKKYVDNIKSAFEEKDFLELTNNLYLLDHSLKHFRLKKSE